MDDIRLEKALEALIDDMANDMGEAAKECFVLRRLEEIMLELKSVNNSEILRQIGTGKTTEFSKKSCRSCGGLPE